MRLAAAIAVLIGLAGCNVSSPDGQDSVGFLAQETAFATRTCVQNNFAAAPVKAAMLTRGYKVLEITTSKDLERVQPGVNWMSAARFTALGTNPCAWMPGGHFGQAVIDAAAAELRRLGYVETAEQGLWSKNGAKVRLNGQRITRPGAGINAAFVGVSAAS